MYPRRVRESTFIAVSLLTFIAVGLILILNHEIWRDEWQAWLIAKESSSLLHLWQNLRYEGHPGFWHLALYLLTRFTRQALAMQLLHLLIASATAFVFLKYAPFTRLQKLLFIFGYFPLYEYAAISRNYALGVFLIFLFCALARARLRRKLLFLAVVLFLLSQTNIYGLIIAMALGSTIFLAWLLKQNLAGMPPENPSDPVIGLFIFVAGIAVSLLQIIPPADSGFVSGWNLQPSAEYLVYSGRTIWVSYMPIPEFSFHLWNTNIITDLNWQYRLSLVLLIICLFLFLRRPAILWLYFSGTMGLLAFFYLKHPGFLRHHGHLFILLLGCLWLAQDLPETRPKLPLFDLVSKFCWDHRGTFLLGLLTAHLLAGLMAGGWDLLQPFSGSKEIAKFIKDSNYNKLVIVGDVDFAASAVAGYLDRPIHYPASGKTGSFIVWDLGRRKLPPQEALQKARELTLQLQEPTLVLLNYRLPQEFPLRCLHQSPCSIEESENFFLYLLEPQSSE
jgi:hypothetical protein